jgi:hypothetical protein
VDVGRVRYDLTSDLTAKPPPVAWDDASWAETAVALAEHVVGMGSINHRIGYVSPVAERERGCGFVDRPITAYKPLDRLAAVGGNWHVKTE